jgi:hypothetical protein
LSSHLAPSAFVERLLEAEYPIWYRWDNDIPALARELTDAAHRDFQSQSKGEPCLGRRFQYTRRRRLLWLLNRLLPLSDAATFAPFTNDPFGRFAWARRVGAERRDQLIDTSPASPGLQGVQMLAWCDSCPKDEVSSLLDWAQAWKPVLTRACLVLLPFAEEEFYRRFPDRPVRYQLLCTHLAAAAERFRNEGEIERSAARGSIHQLLKLSLKDAAAMSSCPDRPIPTSTDGWSAWLDEMLATAPFADVARAAGEFMSWWRATNLGSEVAEYHARWVWVYCHTQTDWPRLHELACQENDWFIFDHLADIAPPDQLEAWGSLVLHQAEDHGQIRAFCRWLPPTYCHVLQDHFAHPDSDWAACAYQAYLAKAPEPVLLHEWRRREERPTWQMKLLDRRLFAPYAVRPGPIVEDIQRVDFDLRLEDPFSGRGV